VTDRPPLRAVLRRRRFWNAAREERAWRLARWGLALSLVVVVIGGAFLARDWWLVRAYLTGPDLRLAQVCADSPFAEGLVTAAGGLAGVRADPEVLAPYLADVPALDEAARAIRDHASLVGDDELSLAATTVLVGRPHRVPVQTGVVEQRCAERVRAAELGGG
jgi:hypothetical protein